MIVNEKYDPLLHPAEVIGEDLQAAPAPLLHRIRGLTTSMSCIS